MGWAQLALNILKKEARGLLNKTSVSSIRKEKEDQNEDLAKNQGKTEGVSLLTCAKQLRGKTLSVLVQISRCDVLFTSIDIALNLESLRCFFKISTWQDLKTFYNVLGYPFL